jgi:hypothetical protein
LLQRIQRDLRLQQRVNLPSRLRHAPFRSIRRRLLPTMPLVPRSGATSKRPTRAVFRLADDQQTFLIIEHGTAHRPSTLYSGFLTGTGLDRVCEEGRSGGGCDVTESNCPT